MEFVVTAQSEKTRRARRTALVCDESEILGVCACEMLAGTAVAPVI